MDGTSRKKGFAAISILLILALSLSGCAIFSGDEEAPLFVKSQEKIKTVHEAKVAEEEARKAEEEAKAAEEAKKAEEEAAQNGSVNYGTLSIATDYRSSFVHGEKPAQYQKYIVLHDTEGTSDAYSVISWWDSNGRGIAAHFVINKDGTVVQCVPLDKIAHHAGYGNTGHNSSFGVTDESRDDKVGTTYISDSLADYGMNSYSVGIEMVHVGGESYPEAQLQALDQLIAYIDNYYGFQSTIIDHKMWRNGNSDTDANFAGYLQNYRDHRTHN